MNDNDEEGQRPRSLNPGRKNPERGDSAPRGRRDDNRGFRPNASGAPRGRDGDNRSSRGGSGFSPRGGGSESRRSDSRGFDDRRSSRDEGPRYGSDRRSDDRSDRGARPERRDQGSWQGRDGDRRGSGDRDGRSGDRRPARREDRGPAGREGAGERRPWDRDRSGGRDGDRRPPARDERGNREDRRPEGRAGSGGERRPWERDRTSQPDRERRPFTGGQGRDDRRGSDRDRGGRDGESRRPYDRDARGGRGPERPQNRRDQDRREGGSKPWQSRGDRPQGRSYRAEEAEEQLPKQFRPGLAPAENEPDTPRDVDLKELPRGVRAELRGLPEDLATVVGSHLVAAGVLVEDDPQRAYDHALAAKRRASRLAITREAVAETAYAAGHYEVALNEYRALRRMTGDDSVLPVMADCERALGRHDAALRLIAQGESARLFADDRVELRLIQAGIRDDLGQTAEAGRLLRDAITTFDGAPPLARARIRYAYAEHLLAQGKEAEARSWLERAIQLDVQDASGAALRLAELDGMILVIGDDDDDDEESVAETEPRQVHRYDDVDDDGQEGDFDEQEAQDLEDEDEQDVDVAPAPDVIEEASTHSEAEDSQEMAGEQDAAKASEASHPLHTADG